MYGSVFDHPDFAGHEEIHFVNDDAAGMQAVIAVHSTRLGPALGGTRYLRYAEPAHAVADALRLSSGMTAKAAMAGLPLGGGKAVILADPSADRSAVLTAYARRVEQMGGRFITSEDVGISEADADLIHHGTQFIAGLSGREGGLGDPSPRTAGGVLGAMHAALAHLTGSASLQGRRVVVTGLGKVGAHLCRLLDEEGAELLVADVDSAAIDRVRNATIRTVQVVDSAVAHRVDCDIFSPCALGGVLNPSVIDELRCAAVVGSANNQLATAPCAELLSARGVLYVPDYVANAGGLIQVAGEWLGYGMREIVCRVEAIEQTVATLLDTAEVTSTTPLAAADRIVARRLAGA